MIKVDRAVAQLIKERKDFTQPTLSHILVAISISQLHHLILAQLKIEENLNNQNNRVVQKLHRYNQAKISTEQSMIF